MIKTSKYQAFDAKKHLNIRDFFTIMFFSLIFFKSEPKTKVGAGVKMRRILPAASSLDAYHLPSSTELNSQHSVHVTLMLWVQT